MARPAQKDWGLSFQEDNKPPVADENMEQLAQYDAFYAENTTEKVLYLTFDCGYENGNTPAILDALKQRQQSAAGKGAWVSDDFLEPCLCGLEAGGTADPRRGDVKAVKKSSSGSDCTAAQYVPDER